MQSIPIRAVAKGPLSPLDALSGYLEASGRTVQFIVTLLLWVSLHLQDTGCLSPYGEYLVMLPVSGGLMACRL